MGLIIKKAGILLLKKTGNLLVKKTPITSCGPLPSI